MDHVEPLTEQANPASAHIDKLATVEMLRVINDEDRKVADSVTPEIPHIARAVDAIVVAIGQGGRLFYIGAGTSGRLGVLVLCRQSRVGKGPQLICFPAA